MTASRPATEILAERMQLLLAIGEANAAVQRAQAVAGGVEIDVMNVEEQLETSGPSEALHAQLERARGRDDAARTALAAAEAKREALEQQLARLDRELASATR
ncbi:MAG: hypothetical protein U5L06_08085 [Rhodovibrio sp.]|nr:hypothetical protein [Rhodovibrio sp.]